MTAIADWLEQRAVSHADTVALHCAGQPLTFADVAGDARAVDAFLSGRGLAAGQRVATLMPGRRELVAIAHGAPRGGRILVPLGMRATAAEVAGFLRHCNATILFYDRNTRDLASTIDGVERISIDDQPLPGDDVFQIADQRRAVPRSERIDLAQTHSIVFTSGTSGTPRGVRLTWGNHFFSAVASALNLGLSADDRWLLCLPLNHVGGLSVLIRSALYGTTVDLQPRFHPEEVNRAIDTRAVSIVSVVANMLQRMLDAHGDRAYPASLRAVLVGGGPTPRSLIERCLQQGVPVLPTYGLTETASQVATASPHHAFPSTSAGRLLPFAEARIANADGQPVAPGERGEIHLRGPMISPGYDGEAERTDQWLCTRDSGWLDREGYLHVLGRADETILSGGENVHPGEVERVLELHNAVAEAFATGHPDPQWGEVVHAAVRVTAATDSAALQSHCRAHLAGFKVPRQIAIVDDFPRTAAGKIARAEAAKTLFQNPKNCA